MHIRGDDKAMSICALEVTHRLQRDKLEERSREILSENPIEIFERIARLEPLLAAKLASEKGMDWKPAGCDALRRCPQCRQVVPSPGTHLRSRAKGQRRECFLRGGSSGGLTVADVFDLGGDIPVTR
jgi:hypothetical protein